MFHTGKPADEPLSCYKACLWTTGVSELTPLLVQTKDRFLLL